MTDGDVGSINTIFGLPVKIGIASGSTRMGNDDTFSIILFRRYENAKTSCSPYIDPSGYDFPFKLKGTQSRIHA
jgi:hypothetical protein